MQRVEALLERRCRLARAAPGSRSPGRGSACRRRTSTCWARAGDALGVHPLARAAPRARRAIAGSSSSATSRDVSRISVWANSLRKSATRSPSAHSRPGRRRDDHRERAHQLGHGVGVQRAGAAERDERELARVVAALDADHAQRAGHVLVDDPQDAVGGLLEAEAHRVGDRLHGRARRVDVERHLAADQPRRQVAERRRWRRSPSAPRRPGRRRPGRARRPPTAGRRAARRSARGTWAIEPPPAPTVCTSTLGTLIRNWPIVVSRPIVGSPAWHSETSVDVPPMSNVRMFGKPARVAT